MNMRYVVLAAIGFFACEACSAPHGTGRGEVSEPRRVVGGGAAYRVSLEPGGQLPAPGGDGAEVERFDVLVVRAPLEFDFDEVVPWDGFAGPVGAYFPSDLYPGDEAYVAVFMRKPVVVAVARYELVEMMSALLWEEGVGFAWTDGAMDKELVVPLSLYGRARKLIERPEFAGVTVFREPQDASH